MSKFLRNTFLVIIILFGSVSCSSLSPVTAASALLGNKPTLAVDAQVGGEKTQALQSNNNDKIEVKESAGPVAVTTSKAKNIYEGVQQVVVKEDVPLNIWLLCILGWLLPSPGEIYREIKSWFTGFFGLFKRST